MKFSGVLITSLVLLAGNAVSQEVSSANQPKNTEKAEIAPHEQLARNILDSAATETSALEPAPRAYLCYLTAKGMVKYDRPKTEELLQRCFDDSTQIDDSDRDGKDNRNQIQSMIVQDLLEFGPNAVEDLLPRASGNAKGRIRSILITHYTKEKDFDKAISLIDGIRVEEESFPYSAVANLMVRLPEEQQGLKTSLFSRALADYTKRPKNPNNFSSEDMATFVVRFYRAVPKNMVLEAVDEVLKHAEPDSSHPATDTVHLRNSDNNVSFASVYESRVFQMIPVLKALDPGRAEDLLKKYQNVQAQLKVFPDGMRSISPAYKDAPLGDDEKPNMSISIRGGGGNSREMSDEDLIRANKLGGEIVKTAKDNPRQAIAQAVSMPTGTERLRTARARTLEGIARALQKSSPSFAKSALDELGKASNDLAYLNAQDYLFSAATILTAMDEDEAALKFIKQASTLAKKLYEKDTDASDPNKALRSTWPSASVWRTATLAARKISPQAALEIVKDVNDPEIQLFERISLANAWLGVKGTNRIVMDKRKSGSDINFMNDLED
jgi:hypothetical protein